jgi:hypothetical protein
MRRLKAQVLLTIDRLADLPSSTTQAVIINCGTRWVTSLALMSALTHTDAPVLVINCESQDGSRRHFEALARAHHLALHWLEWPLRPHGDALDALFREIPAENVLLIDSDLELRTASLFDLMLCRLNSDANAYGAGFLHGPAWLGSEQGLPPHTAYYAERMWLPLVLLRTRAVRSALERGSSFRHRRTFLELPHHPQLARALGYRFRIRGLRHVRLRRRQAQPNDRHIVIDGHRPAFIEYDTGADIHKDLMDHGSTFARLDERHWGDVTHHHGVTRTGLASVARRLANSIGLTSTGTETTQGSVLHEVKQRLATVYHIDLP